MVDIESQDHLTMLELVASVLLFRIAGTTKIRILKEEFESLMSRFPDRDLMLVAKDTSEYAEFQLMPRGQAILMLEELIAKDHGLDS